MTSRLRWRTWLGIALIPLTAVFALGATGQMDLQTTAAWMVSERIERVERNVAYGPSPRHRLDIYHREPSAPRGPVILFLYGGGWRSGDRSLYPFVGGALAKRGFTVVIPDYRLYPQVRFPAFIEDAARAYAYAVKHLAEDASDDAKRCGIVVMGHSAGAHSAAMLAYDRRYIEAAVPGALPPSALVGLAGPYAFDPTTWDTTQEIFSTAPSADDARPVAHVSPGAPPALLFHGTADDVVKPWNAETLAKALREAGSDGEFVQPTGIGHLGILTSIAWPLRWRADVLDRVTAFVRANGEC